VVVAAPACRAAGPDGLTFHPDHHVAGATVTELLPLGFGHCALVLAVPKDGGASRLEDLAGRRIATKYPRTAGRFLAARGIEAELVVLSGALELDPVLDLASAIIDISASGTSLVAHDLVPSR